MSNKVVVNCAVLSIFQPNDAGRPNLLDQKVISLPTLIRLFPGFCAKVENQVYVRCVWRLLKLLHIFSVLVLFLLPLLIIDVNFVKVIDLILAVEHSKFASWCRSGSCIITKPSVNLTSNLRMYSKLTMSKSKFIKLLLVILLDANSQRQHVPTSCWWLRRPKALRNFDLTWLLKRYLKTFINLETQYTQTYILDS